MRLSTFHIAISEPLLKPALPRYTVNLLRFSPPFHLWHFLPQTPPPPPPPPTTTSIAASFCDTRISTNGGIYDANWIIYSGESVLTCLLKTMLHPTYALLSTTETLNEDCAKLSSIFSRLDYLTSLINSTINMFIQNIANEPERKTDDGNTIRIVLPFQDKIAANAVRRQLFDLSHKIAAPLQTILCVRVCVCVRERERANKWSKSLNRYKFRRVF